MNLALHDKLLVIIGPSGAGKSSIVNLLCEQEITELTPTWTDRPTRHVEHSLEHVFVSSDELDRKSSDGFFIHEPLPMFGLEYRYGLPKINKPTPGKIPTIMMRVGVLELVKHYYPNAVIYQIEAPKDRIAAQLHKREDQGAPLGTRLADYEAEIAVGRGKANRVFNNANLSKTLDDIKSALLKDFAID